MLHIETNEDYNQIVDEYSDMIFRIAYQILYNYHDSEDVVQNVFIKLLKQKDICFENEKHLKSWLIRVTINNSLDCKKSFFRKSTTSIEDYDFPFEQKEQLIMEELYELPVKYRTVLYLYYYEEYTIREIAEILKKKQNTINSLLTRGRNKLKLIMEAKHEQNN